MMEIVQEEISVFMAEIPTTLITFQTVDGCIRNKALTV
jgi:hypothetical protein